MEICVFGDSIAWGAFDFEKGGWVERMKMDLAKGDRAIVYNLGISGDNTAELLKRFDFESQMREPGLIIIEIGKNDSALMKPSDLPWVNIAQFQHNLEKLIKIARKYTKHVICLGLANVDESKTMPVPWDNHISYSNGSVIEYDRAIQRVCEATKAKYVSLKELITNADLADGLHPNEQGHKKVFRRVLQAIAPHLISPGR